MSLKVHEHKKRWVTISISSHKPWHKQNFFAHFFRRLSPNLLYSWNIFFWNVLFAFGFSSQKCFGHIRCYTIRFSYKWWYYYIGQCSVLASSVRVVFCLTVLLPLIHLRLFFPIFFRFLYMVRSHCIGTCIRSVGAPSPPLSPPFFISPAPSSSPPSERHSVFGHLYGILHPLSDLFFVTIC